MKVCWIFLTNYYRSSIPWSSVLIVPWREALLSFSISRLFINKMGSVYSTFGQMCTMSFKFVAEEIKTKTKQNKKNFTRLMVCKLHAKQSTVEVSQEAKATLRKKKRSWRNQASWLQTILQSYSNQNSMVLAQKQKYRSMEQDRKPRDKPTHLWSPYLWQRRQEYTMEKRQPL